MKKILAFLMALCLLAAFCGCKEQKEENEGSGKPGISQGGADAEETQGTQSTKQPVSIYGDGSN